MSRLKAEYELRLSAAKAALQSAMFGLETKDAKRGADEDEALDVTSKEEGEDILPIFERVSYSECENGDNEGRMLSDVLNQDLSAFEGGQQPLDNDAALFRRR